MKISGIRWTILTISFFVLLFGAYLNLYFGYFLPSFSCCYVNSRAGTCFMLTLQQTLGVLTLDSMLVFLERFFYFSILVIILGRAWCGWICPLGFFQEILDFIRRISGIGYIRFSDKLKKSLGWIKWLLFFMASLLPLWVACPVFCPIVALDLRIPYCQLCPGKYILPLLAGNPNRVAVNFSSITHMVMSTLGLLISSSVIVGAFIKRRFWCHFCPLGLILSFYRRLGFLKLKKNDAKCTKCEICYNVCPVEIKQVFQSRGRKDVTFSECTLCLKCVEHCPEPGALKASYLGKTIYKSSGLKTLEKQNSLIMDK